MPSITHEALIRAFRNKSIYRGFRDRKSPMPTFRPDVFGENANRNNGRIVQIAMEAEIRSTLFSSHTEEQLSQMHEFLHLQQRKGIRAYGYLVVPSGKDLKIEAEMRLYSLFPYDTDIKLMQLGT